MKNLLKSFREKAKLTQVEAAASTGLSLQKIRRFDQGSAIPDLKELAALIRVYKLKQSDINRLLKGEVS